MLCHHHLDLPMFTVSEAKIPFHRNSLIAVHVNFGLAFGKHFIIDGIEGRLSDCDSSKSSFDFVSICQASINGILEMWKGYASDTPAEKGAESSLCSWVLQRSCSTSCLACSCRCYSMLVGRRSLGVNLHVFHSRYIFPQPE